MSLTAEPMHFYISDLLGTKYEYDIKLIFNPSVDDRLKNFITVINDAVAKSTDKPISRILVKGKVLTADNFNELITEEKLATENHGYIRVLFSAPAPVPVPSASTMDNLDMTGGAKKKGKKVAKKSSKKVSKKAPKKASKKSSKKASKSLAGGAKKRGKKAASKKTSKKTSKRTSKKTSRK